MKPTESQQEDLSEYFCYQPFCTLELGRAPEFPATVCCSNWLTRGIGSFADGESLSEVWNSTAAQEIRASIHDGSFRHCDRTQCPLIANRALPKKSEATGYIKEILENRETVLARGPTDVVLSNDLTCNLHCPACRTERIGVTQGSEWEAMKEVQGRVLKAALPETRTLVITGSGDPLASRLYRELLEELSSANFPDLKITLNTNGVLLTPGMWERLRKIRKNIRTIFVSVDAATKEVYEKVRKGGDFAQLQRNLDFIGDLRRERKLDFLRMDFVVQQQNYHELPQFVERAREVGADRVFLQKIVNWGTFSPTEFSEKAVWQKTHPEYAQLQQILAKPILRDDLVFKGNLQS